MSVAATMTPARSMTARLGLGTVQFGLPYGLTGGPSKLAAQDVHTVLSRAWEEGIDLLDTAPAYGEAEAVIAAQWPRGARFAVVSKTRRIGRDAVTAEDVAEVVARAQESVARLPVEHLHALLVHEANDLLVPGGERLFDALVPLRRDGRVRRLGVSVYHPEILERVLASFPIEAVQLPFNALDQRFARSGLIARLAAAGIEVHVRSIFMQGFLIAEPVAMPEALRRVTPLAVQLRAMAAAAGLDAASAALLIAAREPGVVRILVGVNSLASLEANVASLARVRSWSGTLDFAPFAIEDHDIVDPRRWSSWPPVSTPSRGLL
jgi:aryl-alcohol dehydrogenase-like predicted oxidoreductase